MSRVSTLAPKDANGWWCAEVQGSTRRWCAEVQGSTRFGTDEREPVGWIADVETTIV